MIGRWDPLLERYAPQYDLSLLLARKVLERESGGNPRAVSPAGAKGLMQLMPDTAREMGVTDPFDPEQSVRGGLGYLRKQIDRFGDPILGVAAYHSGPGTVARTGGDLSKLGPRGRAYVAALAPYATDGQRPGLLAEGDEEAPMPMSQTEPTQGQAPSGMLGQDTMAAMLNNPMILMGASIMAANGSKMAKGLLNATAAWQGMRQSKALEEQRRTAIEMAKLKQTEMQREQAMRQQMMQYLISGGGAAGAPGVAGMPGDGRLDPQRLLNAATIGALGGVEGAGTLGTVGAAMLPYANMTQAQRADMEDRRARAAYEGVPGAVGGAAMPGGLSPKGQQEVYQKGAEGLIGMDVKRLTDMSEKASAARAMMPSLERMIRTNAEVPEGRLAPAQVFAGQMAGSIDNWLGTDFKNWFGGDATIADAEQFFADSANLIRERIKALGSGTAISNADLLFTRESVPALLQTKEGRQKMLEAFKVDAENLQDAYKQADKYFRANKGKGLEGFEPQGLKRAGFLKKVYVVGPNGERHEMVNEYAAKSVVNARPGWQMVVED